MYYCNKNCDFSLHWKMVEILPHFTWEPSSAEMNNSWFLPHQPKWKWLNTVSTSQTIQEQNKFTCNTYRGEQNTAEWINLFLEWLKLILQATSRCLFTDTGVKRTNTSGSFLPLWILPVILQRRMRQEVQYKWKIQEGQSHNKTVIGHKAIHMVPDALSQWWCHITVAAFTKLFHAGRKVKQI